MEFISINFIHLKICNLKYNLIINKISYHG